MIEKSWASSRDSQLRHGKERERGPVGRSFEKQEKQRNWGGFWEI